MSPYFTRGAVRAIPVVLVLNFVSGGRVNRASNKSFWAALFGNILDHYDTAVYGLLAPILAPLFFPNKDATLSLFYTYLLMSVSLISKPLGSLFFGRLSLKRSPKQALIISLFGIGLSTSIMGALPTYAQAGILAPLALSLCRLLQGFFGAGEQTIGNLYLLEQTPERHRGKINSAFSTSCIIGILTASLASTLVFNSHTPQAFWRLPFLAGSLTAVIGLFIRSYLPDLSLDLRPSLPNRLFIKESRGPFIRIIFASSFNYLTYSIPFIFFNHFIPIIAPIEASVMLHYNSLLLMLDFLLLFVFGFISDRFSPSKWMSFWSALLAFTVVPFFQFLPQATLLTVLLIRIWIVLIGVAFQVTLQKWFLSLLPRDQCYLLSGFGYSLGAELFGKSTPAICLFLWRQFHSTSAPAFYILFVALCALWAVLTTPRKSLSPEMNSVQRFPLNKFSQ